MSHAYKIANNCFWHILWLYTSSNQNPTTSPPHIRHTHLPTKIANIVFDTWPCSSKYIKCGYNKKSGNYNKKCGWNFNIFHHHLLLLVPFPTVFLPFPPTRWNFVGLDTPHVLPLNPLAVVPQLPSLGTPLVLIDALGCITKIQKLATWSNNSK